MASPSRAAVPVAPGLFTVLDDGPRLIGSRCEACGVMTFPSQADCPRCADGDMRESLFTNRGSLWTFTVQRFPPKSPPYARQETDENFVPYAVGYVELPGQARVEGRIDTADVDALAIGDEMEVVVVPLTVDAEGNDVVTYAFRPVREREVAS